MIYPKKNPKKLLIKQKERDIVLGEKISDKRHKISSKIKTTAKSKIQKTVNAGKNLKMSKKENLELLENLAKLKDAKIITAKEFQEKKKKILSKI